MQLEQALLQIGDIRSQMLRTRTFRGYRAITTFCTAIGAVVAACIQAWRIPHPAAAQLHFVDLWTELAITCLVLVGVEIVQSYRATPSTLDRDLTLKAAWQFAPCILVGGLLTYVLVAFSIHEVWMLPGLWQILFAMGMFASRDLLPRSISLVGAFYILTGICCLAMGPDFSYSPWAMGAPFAVGQTLAALCLHASREVEYAA